MSDRGALQAEPYRFDFFDTLRRLERGRPDKPRIGNSASGSDDYALLGQDPFMDFPASTFSKVEPVGNDQLRLLVKFLGLMGPQGALPLATTEEALGWNLMGEDGFPRFLDLINHRFLQLFFRAWSDSRPIAQHDRPNDDRFQTYMGAMIGLGSAPFARLDGVPDESKLGFAGLTAPQAKSASRLRGLICGLFGVETEIEEFVGARYTLIDEDLTRLGARNSRLGEDVILGGACFSIEDKFRVRIYTKYLAQYVEFLPTGRRCEPLADLVFFYAGEALDWDVELALPAPSAEPVKLGDFGQLGWTSWIAPNWASTETWRRDARFSPAEYMRHKRAHPA